MCNEQRFSLDGKNVSRLTSAILMMLGAKVSLMPDSSLNSDVYHVGGVSHTSRFSGSMERLQSALVEQ